ncbi:MAG: DNA-directed RNA polymerase subunit alpha, partial [Nakamurella sp.]
NFGQKSIDEVKVKLHQMGLALKDSPPGFDPTAAALAYGNDWGSNGADSGAAADDAGTDDDYAETEQI